MGGRCIVCGQLRNTPVSCFTPTASSFTTLNALNYEELVSDLQELPQVNFSVRLDIISSQVRTASMTHPVCRHTVTNPLPYLVLAIWVVDWIEFVGAATAWFVSFAACHMAVMMVVVFGNVVGLSIRGVDYSVVSHIRYHSLLVPRIGIST
jgi:hypothetical protein